MPAARRLLIISDTHMGHGPRHPVTAAALAPLLSGITHLIVNGDVAEMREGEDNPEAERQLLALQQCCNDHDVELDLLAGNHDPFLTELRYLHLAEGRVLVTHGDAFHPGIAPWSVHGRAMEENFRAAHASMDDAARESIHAHLDLTARIAKWQFDQEQITRKKDTLLSYLLPWRTLGVLRYWREVPDLAAAFAQRYTPEAKVVIFGHSHRQGIWRRRDRLMINTGSYTFPGRPWAVLVSDGRLSVYRIERREGAYHLAEAPHAVFSVDGEPVAEG